MKNAGTIDLSMAYRMGYGYSIGYGLEFVLQHGLLTYSVGYWPTAWAAWAIGLKPGQHGYFDLQPGLLAYGMGIGLKPGLFGLQI